jgi:hypothetical protein
VRKPARRVAHKTTRARSRKTTQKHVPTRGLYGWITHMDLAFRAASRFGHLTIEAAHGRRVVPVPEHSFLDPLTFSGVPQTCLPSSVPLDAESDNFFN